MALNDKDRSHIEKLDDDLSAFLTCIEEGNAPNPTKLLHIEEELELLVKNDKIPKKVKQSLLAAQKKVSSTDLYGAKDEVDNALEQ